MRAVAVDVARRADLPAIDRPGILGAGDEVAGADQFVVAVSLVEGLAGLANAIPVFGRLEHEFVFELVEAPAQPAPEKGHLGPGTAAQARPVGFLRVRHRRVLRVDAAVDEADDDAVAVQSLGAAQATVRIEQSQEAGTEIGRQRPDLVLPDVQDLRHVFEFVRLGGGHFRRKPVEAVKITVDLAGIGRGLHEELVLFGAQLFCVTRDRGTGLVETRARGLLRRHGRRGLVQRGVIHRG